MILVRDYLEKVSGTTSKLLFQILEAITKQGNKLTYPMKRLLTILSKQGNSFALIFTTKLNSVMVVNKLS